MGLRAEDYTSDKVEGLDKLYSGKTDHRQPAVRVDRDVLWKRRDRRFVVVSGDREPIANENFILRNGSKSALARYRAADRSLLRVEKLSAYGISPRNAEQSFALGVLTDPEIRLVTLAGKAGTGKTLLALAAALQCRSHYRQVLLARPVVPLSNRDLGYLPG
jgi:PhoH-like ATPase